jgi:hypothetical protein
MLKRVDGAFILNGTQTLTFVVAAGTQTGLQAGYAIDGGAKKWLPVVTATTKSFSVEVPSDSHEDQAARWTFWYQLNVDAAKQDCYTGFGTGERSIRVTAVAAPATP